MKINNLLKLINFFIAVNQQIASSNFVADQRILVFIIKGIKGMISMPKNLSISTFQLTILSLITV